jgi:hypothetical protein
MIEISSTEMFLMMWAVAASGLAAHFYGLARHRGQLLIGAAAFTKKLLEDDAMRDELRAHFRTMRDAEVRFGAGD